MRYYPDTQTLAQIIFSADSIHPSLIDVITDYSTLLLTSTVCMKELVHLIQSGRIRPKRKGTHYDAHEAVSAVVRAGIDVVPPSLRHISQMADLPLFPDHNDPNDRLIIAQSIADRVPLISTDLQFEKYIPYGLELIRNR